MRTLSILTLSLAMLATLGLSRPASADEPMDIVDTAVEAGSFNTLAAALEAAGLVDALKGDGPFTVFAPTDEAFKALPDGTLESLLEEENNDTLVAILTYHVVPGSINSTEALEAGSATTLQGSDVTISVEDGQPMVNNANIVSTDIECSNGVIHVIDAVILPPSADE